MIYNKITSIIDDKYEWQVTPEPKFGKKFKPIFIKQTCYDEGEDDPPVCLFEVKWLGVSAWDIFDDIFFRDDYTEASMFVSEILEKFYDLVQKDDPKIKEYIL